MRWALRSRLLSVHADQSRVTGWLCYDLDDFDGAATCYEQARTDAHEAEDTALAARLAGEIHAVRARMQPWQDSSAVT